MNALFKFGKKQPASDALTPPAAKSGRTHQPGVPLELVKYDTETGKFEVGREAARVLRNARDPIGVVAVCGRARQGKSFILNQLLGQSTGFQVRRIYIQVSCAALLCKLRCHKPGAWLTSEWLSAPLVPQVAPSVRPCTKGLWMWSTPIQRQAVDGSPYQLVLLDSEGIDAWDQASALVAAHAARCSIHLSRSVRRLSIACLCVTSDMPAC